MPPFLANEIVHAGRASIRKLDAGGLRPGDDVQIRPAEIWREIGLGGAASLAIDFHDLAGSAALLPGAVVIGIARNADRFAGREEGVVERARAAQIGHVERSADAAPFVLADALVVFGPLEI